jgi:outer membrane receptor protein involved in Fe transport
MNKGCLHGAGLLAAAFFPVFAARAAAPVDLEPVEVTATRTPEPVDRVPASVTVIGGDELRARGATDLRTALSLVAGVEAPPGGDAGPASAVPSIWGLHEFDAFLLVVDGIPWGGAFNPAIPTLDLNDVERIEVVRGAAPAVYGATSFVGVIQVIHYPAGTAANQAAVSYGSYGSVSGSASRALPGIGGYRHSLGLGAERQKFSDGREQINNGRLLYRGAADLGGGELRIDSDITLQHTVPNSPVARQGVDLVTPTDANFNPADARIDERKFHFVLGYSLDTALGRWESTASYAHSSIGDIRGFIRADNLASDPGDRGNNADYQSQGRGILDSYFDSHFSKELGREIDLVYGADLLYGSGKQQSFNGAYCAGGSAAPYSCPPGQDQVPPLATSQLPVDEINGIDDRRAFFGQYAQLDWKPDERLDLNAGLRVSETRERKTSSHIDTADATANELFPDVHSSKTRLSGLAGASYQAWHQGADEAVVYADYRNTFKPATIDFGPDVTPAVLSPETARSYEAGLKGRLLDGRLDYDSSLFLLHMNNLVRPTPAGDLANTGSEIFKGLELETRYHLAGDLQLALNYSWHAARFGSSDGGTRVDLSPNSLGAAGVLYTPKQGLYGSLIANYVGRRYLDPADEASSGSYVLLDATLGYRWRRWFAAVGASNIGDTRKPVTNSEFGADQFYLLPRRTVLMTLGMKL